LLQSGVRKVAHEGADLLADGFVEFGSSGSVFTKPQIIEALEHEPAAQRSLSDFQVTLLAPGVILATYCVTRDGLQGEDPVRSLRGSIWKWIDGRWQMVFHQGTLKPL
jgi:hypothetical protein